jgi:co-chaperonin GroES (HSP10)
MTTEEKNQAAADIEAAIKTPAVFEDPFEAQRLRTNPFGLNIKAEGNRIILHIESKDVTKGGIHLTEAAKKEIAAAEAQSNSKLYYIIGVAEAVADKYKPGMWVLLSPDAMGHSFKLDGKEMMMVEAYAVAGVVTYHEEEDVESQYKHGSTDYLDDAKGRIEVNRLNEAGRGIDGEQYQYIPKA